MSPEYIAEWIRKAEADRTAAKRALQDSLRHPDQAEIACYHAQQCVEKYLKALLAKKGRPIPRTHDLLALADRTRRLRFSSAKLQEDLELLNHYAVRIRYPGASATVAEARKAVRAMERVVHACLSKRWLKSPP